MWEMREAHNNHWNNTNGSDYVFPFILLHCFIFYPTRCFSFSTSSSFFFSFQQSIFSTYFPRSINIANMVERLFFFLLFFKFQKLHLFFTNFTSIVFHSQQVIQAQSQTNPLSFLFPLSSYWKPSTRIY